MLTLDDIETIRRTGRDEVARSTTIGLAELDALCDTALQAVSLKRRKLPVRVNSVVVTASGSGVIVGSAHHKNGVYVERADLDDLMAALRRAIYE